MADNTNPEQDDPTSQETDETILTWDEFLAKQTEEIRKLYQTHSSGLLNTVKATRKERDDFKADLKKLAKQQEDGSDAQKALEKMSIDLEKTGHRADFMEEAMLPEVQCRNPRAAWLIAESSELFDKRGKPDWDAIKREAPELFGAVIANVNAHTNSDTGPVTKNRSMNAFIRKAAGRQ